MFALKDRRIFNGTTKKDVFSIKAEFKESQCTYGTARQVGNIKIYVVKYDCINIFCVKY